MFSMQANIDTYFSLNDYAVFKGVEVRIGCFFQGATDVGFHCLKQKCVFVVRMLKHAHTNRGLQETDRN